MEDSAEAAEAGYCYYALHKLHYLPNEIMSLPDREKAFIYAAIDIKIKNDKKEAEKAKRKK